MFRFDFRYNFAFEPKSTSEVSLMCTGDESCGNGGLFGALFPGKGEVGAFRVLRYLFNHDEKFRSTFLSSLFSEKDCKELATADAKMKLEVFINETDENFGRIDAVIDGQNFVIAIEGKFGASFQTRQLERYGDWLVKRDVKHPWLIVITPKSRPVDVPLIVEGINTNVVHWECLVRQFREYIGKQESEKSDSKHLILEWLCFLETLCGTYDWNNVPDDPSQFTQEKMLEFLNAAHPLFSDTRYELCEKKLWWWHRSSKLRVFASRTSKRRLL